MRLVHTTFEDNRESILDIGISVKKSRGAFRRVWLHIRGRKRWGMRHVCARHHGKAKDVIHIHVNVPNGWLHRIADGLYFSERDIPPECIVEIEGSGR